MHEQDPRERERERERETECDAPEGVVAEAGESGDHGGFARRALPWIAIVVVAIVAALLTRAASPLLFFHEDLEFIGITRVAKLLFSFAWFALFFGVSRKLPFWARGVLFTIFFLPAAFAAYVKIGYGMDLDYHFIVDCANTNKEEVASHFSAVAVLTLVAFVALMFVAAWIVGKIPACLPRSKIVAAVIVVALVLSANQANLRPWISPVKITLEAEKSWRRYHKGDKVMFEKLAELEKAPQEISLVPAEISHVNSFPIVVLHIGETARADHAPFNGYERNTMPNMLREYEAGNLVSFPKCVSFSVTTLLSMRGILSPSTVMDNVFRHSTFIPALDQSGVATCGFLSRYSGASDKHSTGIALCLLALQKEFMTPDLAGTLLPKIRETLAEDDGNNAARGRFYLYYGEGSHGPYSGYDSDKHAVFKPNIIGIHRYDINNYDNTFIATDEFCGGFIDELRDKNAVYIFVGDHGGMLGEGGISGRPADCPESRHVLFFVWASEKFKAENPELWATLLRNRERLGVISHDFVYNSVLHLFSVKTPFYDERADLFSDAAEPFPDELPVPAGFNEPHFADDIAGETAPAD